MEEIFEEKDRLYLIFMMTALQEDLSIFHYQTFLSVSKNTILSDLKKLKDLLTPYEIELYYSRKTGYNLKGNEQNIRTFIKLSTIALNERAASTAGMKKLFQDDRFALAKISELKYHLIKKYHFSEVPSRSDESLCFIASVVERSQRSTISLKKEDQKFLENLTMYCVVNEFQNELEISLTPDEKAYLTAVFMSTIQGKSSDSSLYFLQKIVEDILLNLNRQAVLYFENFIELKENLLSHLTSAYFRIRFSIPVSDYGLGYLETQKAELYYLVSSALQPLRDNLKKAIPKSEILFFTVLIGAELENQQIVLKEQKLKALVYCASGISSSMMLESILQNLFPEIVFTLIHSKTLLRSFPIEDYDMIFSSISIETKIPQYVVSPIMSQPERTFLYYQVANDFTLKGAFLPSPEKIVKAILPYVTLKENVTHQDLYNSIKKLIFSTDTEVRRERGPMLKELITEDMIQIVDSTDGWEEAITLSAQPLLQSDKISEEYIENMIRKVKDYGPFIHIGTGVALPHARPEEGAKEVGISVLKVNQEVLLLDDPAHPIHVFICLSAVDNELHLKALASLTSILSNKESLNKLLNSTDKEEIYQLFQNEGE